MAGKRKVKSEKSPVDKKKSRSAEASAVAELAEVAGSLL